MPFVTSLPQKSVQADDTTIQRRTQEQLLLDSAQTIIKLLQDGQNFGTEQHYGGYESDLF